MFEFVEAEVKIQIRRIIRNLEKADPHEEEYLTLSQSLKELVQTASILQKMNDN